MTGIRRAADSDLAWMHDLNERNATALSPMTATGFATLVGGAAHARVVPPDGAFMIALDEGADYDSPNFQWFRERYGRFLYVDRIVVSPDWRRRGLARQLYEDLFAHAAGAGYPRVVCEVNADPPNPDSDAFHAALGFQTVGEALLEDRGKTVRYFARPIA